ncbi:protein of unknown function DUF107 [Natranaerobius thermophilus JW/NM-WN-LF]|uniref:Uncharacterized protein n=1 Tax=Natranaerobius thermophilus (strain ATCC BAA-1301 / DSM 18059 / JW/NM-WN-LF) TaxID=457570 RepID=B2A1N9_NATTJ|nr:protein of unknown function DUF107 [Natranaerobius thermophilus JW/NM-WN-LF]
MVRKNFNIFCSFICVLLIFSGLFIHFEEVQAQSLADTGEKTVYQVPVEGNIERGLSAFLNRAFESAQEENADLIVLDINTPGGALDASFEIKDLIVNEEIPVYAFVNSQAISAGSYLALASDEIYMRPTGTMGAAEARMGTEVADEKVMSVWETEMRTVAKERDRDPDIAAAMVRREMEIEGLVSENQLLTLSAEEAKEHGMAEGIVNNYDELLEKTGYEGANIVEYPMEWAERMARFFTSPAVASILLTLGMAGLVIELSSPGLGLPGLVGLLCFGLFFGGHIFAGLAGYEVLLFFIVGIILLLIEAIAAGFGVMGLAGIVSFGFAIVISAESTEQGLMMLLYSLLGTIIVLVIAFRYFVRSRFWDRIILNHSESKDQGYVGTNTEYKNLVGESGVTEGPLRPAGTAQISGERIDVISEGGYIPEGTPVQVSKVEGSRVIVKEIKSEESDQKEEDTE